MEVCCYAGGGGFTGGFLLIDWTGGCTGVPASGFSNKLNCAKA
jgi:hypothetical protein